MDRGAAPVRREAGGPPSGVGGTKKGAPFASSSSEKQKFKPQSTVSAVGRNDDVVPPLKKKQKTTTESSGTSQARDLHQLRLEPSRPRPPRAAAESSSLRSSPFRIRVGCVVAVRCHRTECPSLDVVDPNSLNKDRSRVRLFPPGPGSSNNSSGHGHGGNPGGNWMRVWTDPIPGRDEGLNLIGKRVRAQVPRLAPGQEKTVLEGEVIRLLDYHSPSEGRLPKPHKPLRVEVLVDSRQLQHFPFLKRVEYYDAPAGATTLAGGVAANSSASEASAMLRRHRQQKRQQEFEMRIRGRGTDVVIVKLAPAHSVLAFGKSTSSHYFGSTTVSSSKGAADASNLLKENASRAASVGLSWAVLRLVPAELWWQFQRPPVEESKPSLTSGENKHRAAGAGDACATGEGSNSKAIASATVGGTVGVQSSARIGDDARAAVKRSDQVTSAPLAAEKAAKRAKKGASSASVVQGVRHLGDGADTADRQVHNWRWFAGRFYDLLLRSSANAAPMATHRPIGSAATSPSTVSLSSLVGLLGQVLCGGFIGEVTQIDRTEGDDAQQSLARVTVRRFVLPEHTRTGRLPFHENCDLFEDHDGIGYATGTTDALFEIPIEQLIIVGRKMHRWVSTMDATERPPSSLELLQVSHYYSLRDDEYGSLCPGLNCQQFLARPASLFSYPPQECDDRITVVSRTTPLSVSDGNSITSPFAQAEAAAKSLIAPDDFRLPADFLEFPSQHKPQAQPVVRAKARVAISKRQKSNRERALPKERDRSKLSAEGTVTAVPGFTVDRRVDHQPPLLAETQKEATDTSDGKETCSRVLVYDSSQKRSNLSVALVTDRPRNLREFWRRQKRLESSSTVPSTTREDKSDSRANRANQRRFMKEAAANSSWLLGMDTLASREPQLRFDRSGIHSWGVYADENIAAGEMIVEYRGELIGIAVTEKREAEYLEAKIGSDYMFRIDKLLCCDATKQGNVARFINASCDPNCFTKIITLDGTKRIVIYAKRDIRVGEELCYDYKFPLEYDESKRIPCHCGAKDCRGFMNWNKRYVALDGAEKAEASGQIGPAVAVAQFSNEEKPDQMALSTRDVSFGSRTPSPREVVVRERDAEALAEQAHRLR